MEGCCLQRNGREENQAEPEEQEKQATTTDPFGRETVLSGDRAQRADEPTEAMTMAMILTESESE